MLRGRGQRSQRDPHDDHEGGRDPIDRLAPRRNRPGFRAMLGEDVPGDQAYRQHGAQRYQQVFLQRGNARILPGGGQEEAVV